MAAHPGASEATREVFWNIPFAGQALMYVLVAVTLGVFSYGVFRHYWMWRKGRPANRLGPVGPRLRLVLKHVFAHGRLLAERVAGLYHFGFFWGFIVLFLGTTVVFIHHDLGVRIMRGPFYLYFQSAALDAFGVVAVVAVAAALFERYVRRSPRLRQGIWSDALVLALFETVLLTGFLIEGLRIAATGDPWGAWSFAGWGVAKAALATGLSEPAMRALHAGLWWLHFAAAMTLLGYIPFSKLFHIVLAPFNVYLQPLQAPASPQPIDFEKSERLGVAAFGDFSWKDLFDLDVCTECARCTAVCPADMTGKPLSPMHLVLDLREEMKRTDADSPRVLTGEVIKPETLWACTTCMACMEACPVFIEHVPKILNLRRYLVMEQSEAPDTMQEALRSLEARGHPFRGATASRSDWYQGLDVVELAQAGSADQVDVVYWAGCAAAFDERNQRVARAFVTVLRRAGLRVGVLGPEEQCTGDPARRIGNEFLFEQLARANIETLKRYGVRTIVTTCPHCFNTFKNEYPAFGGRFEMRHHTELLAELVRKRRIKPAAAAGDALRQRITYHDPCYLGRHNGVFEAPREVLEGLRGAELVEMARSRNKSLCCGAGGGRAWVEEKGSERVAAVRAREAVGTGADVLAVACPFCMQMLEDGVKSEARLMRVLDIAELLEQSTREKSAAYAHGGAGANAGRERG